MNDSPSSPTLLRPAPLRSAATTTARGRMCRAGARLAATCLLGHLLAGQAAAQSAPAVTPTPPPPAAAADSASPRGGAGTAAPGRFMDGVNHGFFGNLAAPPPPAMNAIRGVRLPEAAPNPEPAPTTAAKPAAPKPPTEASAATAASTEPPRVVTDSASPAAATAAPDKSQTAEPGSRSKD